jgi:hypothetical protein
MSSQIPTGVWSHDNAIASGAFASVIGLAENTTL